MIAEAYAKGSYDRRVDYSRPPVPPLGAADMAWAVERIAQTQA